MEKTKICTKCKEIKSTINFSKTKRYKDGLHIYCKPCRVKMQREQFLSNPNTQRNYKRKWHKGMKDKVFSHYCNGEIQCAKCCFKDERALTVDHINGGGTQHRKSIGNGDVYRWIVKNNYPNNFQILCMNCQFIKRWEMGEHNPKK